MANFRMHPKKLWECDCCFEVYSCRAININGGFCPNCGNEYFSLVNDGISIFVPSKAPKKRVVPEIKFEEGKMVSSVKEGG